MANPESLIQRRVRAKGAMQETDIPIKKSAIDPHNRNDQASPAYAEVRVRGKVIWVPSAQLDGRTVITIGNWLKVASIREEELLEGDTVAHPDSFLSELRESGLKADLFTFAQRVPDNRPNYSYLMEWGDAAVLPITKFSCWWNELAKNCIRKAVNLAKKLGVVVKLSECNDAFVEAIRSTYNETPVRQG